jgi:hypothetical protein
LRVAGAFPTITTQLFGDAVLSKSTFTYNPSTQGPINSISASVLKDLAVDYATTNSGNTFRPLIKLAMAITVTASACSSHQNTAKADGR